MQKIKDKMTQDRKKIVSKNNIEDLYVWEIANKWLNINVKSRDEFEIKIEAMGKILNSESFRQAVKTSKLAYEEKNTNYKAKEAAELIKKLKETEQYIENAKISGYKILSKYENPSTYKTDAFIVHANIMTRLYNYLSKMQEKDKTL